MAQGGTITLAANSNGAALQTILALSGPATFFIDNRATVAGAVFINTTNFHDLGDAIPVPIGLTYWKVPGGFFNLQIKGDGANAATVGYGLAAKS